MIILSLQAVYAARARAQELACVAVVLRLRTPHPSFPRKRESRFFLTSDAPKNSWIPAFAGMT
jgi:hypothetical protein